MSFSFPVFGIIALQVPENVESEPSITHHEEARGREKKSPGKSRSEEDQTDWWAIQNKLPLTPPE
jgi:hypothetical protein